MMQKTSKTPNEICCVFPANYKRQGRCPLLWGVCLAFSYFGALYVRYIAGAGENKPLCRIRHLFADILNRQICSFHRFHNARFCLIREYEIDWLGTVRRNRGSRSHTLFIGMVTTDIFSLIKMNLILSSPPAVDIRAATSACPT